MRIPSQFNQDSLYRRDNRQRDSAREYRRLIRLALGLAIVVVVMRQASRPAMYQTFFDPSSTAETGGLGNATQASATQASATQASATQALATQAVGTGLTHRRGRSAAESSLPAAQPAKPRVRSGSLPLIERSPIRSSRSCCRATSDCGWSHSRNGRKADRCSWSHPRSSPFRQR